MPHGLSTPPPIPGCPYHPPVPPCPPFPQCPSCPPWGQAPLTLRTSPGWQSAPVPGTPLVAVPRPPPASASVLLNRGLPCPVAPPLENSCSTHGWDSHEQGAVGCHPCGGALGCHLWGHTSCCPPRPRWCHLQGERRGQRGRRGHSHPLAPLGLKVHGEDGHCGAAVTPGYSGAIAQMALTCWGRWGCRGCGGCGGRGGCGSGGPLWGRAGRELRPQLLVLILKPSGFL